MMPSVSLSGRNPSSASSVGGDVLGAAGVFFEARARADAQIVEAGRNV